jgi:hypothetical protein
MISCLVQLYLDSPSRLCRLEKLVEFHAMPRVGEWLKLVNPKMGDYFGFRVAEITHREGSVPELMLARLEPAVGNAAAFPEDELEEYLSSYVECGWKHVSSVPNPHLK